MSEEDLTNQEELAIILSPAQLAHVATLSNNDGWDSFNGGPTINQLVSFVERSDAIASGFRVVLSKDRDAGYSMEVRGSLVAVDITTPGEVQAVLSLFTENVARCPQVFDTYQLAGTLLVYASWEEQ